MLGFSMFFPCPSAPHGRGRPNGRDMCGTGPARRAPREKLHSLELVIGATKTLISPRKNGEKWWIYPKINKQNGKTHGIYGDV